VGSRSKNKSVPRVQAVVIVDGPSSRKGQEKWGTPKVSTFRSLEIADRCGHEEH
jgi:hypothetical protein